MAGSGVSPVLTGTGSSGRTPGVLMAMAAVAVAIVLAKPWGSGPPSGSSESLVPSAEVSTAALPPASAPPHRATVADPSPSDHSAADLADDCLHPLGWRVFSLARWGRGTVRDWAAVLPVAAAGPADPDIPFTPVVGDDVLGLGFCAPIAGPDRPSPSDLVAIWRLDPDGPRSLTPGRLRPRSYSVLGALYGAPPHETSEPAARSSPASLPLVPGWSSGRYVFDIGGRWFGAAVTITAAGAG